MKTIAASAISLMLGLGIGYLAFHNEPLVQTVETNTVKTVQVAVPGKTIVVGAPFPPPAAAAPSSPTPLAPEQEVVALRAKVLELESVLKTELEIRKGAEGEKLPFPAGLPARLRDEKLLVTSFNAALKEAGFPNAQVSNVDCTEHPCIVFGTGFGDREDFDKLTSTSGFAPYAKDSMSTFGFMRGADFSDKAGKGDPSSRFFGVALMPEGTQPSEEISKRIAYRVRQMEEASRPPKK